MDSLTVIIGLKDKTPAEQIIYGGEAGTVMNGNSNFSNQGTKITAINQ